MRLDDFTNESLVGALIKVPRQVRIVQVSSSSAGDSFVINHNLGVVPDDYDWTTPVDARVWHTDDDQKTWTDKTMRVRCSAGAVKVAIMPKSFR